jgi:hypothetical protein
MKIPETNSTIDVQQSFRDVWKELDSLFKKSVNLHGYKFLNVGDSSQQAEFVTRRELDRVERKLESIDLAKGKSAVKVSTSTLSPTRVTITDQIYYDTTTGELKINTGTQAVTIGGRMAKIEDSQTGDVTEVFDIIHTSTGTVASGFGSTMNWKLEDAAGNAAEDACILGVVWEVATSASEDANLYIKLKEGGATPAEVARFTHDRRFQADFCHGTAANRFLFQSAGTNNPTYVGAIPQGSETASGFYAYNGYNPDNSARILMRITDSTGVIATSFSGGGASLPLVFYSAGVESFRIDTSQNIDIASGKVLKVAGTQVLTAQGATVADAGAVSGTATNGGYGFVSAAEMNAAITAINVIKNQLNTLLARVRSHGLIAT